MQRKYHPVTEKEKVITEMIPDEAQALNFVY